MKLTKLLLKKIIKEELKVHFAPENLTDLDPEEAYGLGWQAGNRATDQTLGDEQTQVPTDHWSVPEKEHRSQKRDMWEYN